MGDENKHLGVCVQQDTFDVQSCRLLIVWNNKSAVLSAITDDGNEVATGYLILDYWAKKF